MKKLLFLLILMPTSLCIMVGQTAKNTIPNPVKWKVTADKNSDGEYTVNFNSTIEKNWVVYSTTVKDGPIPTSFEFDEGITAKGSVKEISKAIEEVDPIFEIKLLKYKDNAVFKQDVSVGNSAKKISGFIEFMTCDGSKCLPPVQLQFSVDI